MPKKVLTNLHNKSQTLWSMEQPAPRSHSSDIFVCSAPQSGAGILDHSRVKQFTKKPDLCKKYV